MRRLGAFYSRTLRTEGPQHRVIDIGPYRFIRHPGYTGSLLTWTGFALASRSAPVAALVGGLMGHAYRRRIAPRNTCSAVSCPLHRTTAPRPVAVEDHVEVEATWGIYQRMIAAYRDQTGRTARQR